MTISVITDKIKLVEVTTCNPNLSLSRINQVSNIFNRWCKKMRFKEIKIWLIKNELTQTKLAKRLGVSQTAIYQVMKGRSKSKRIETLLKELGCPCEYLDEEAA